MDKTMNYLIDVLNQTERAAKRNFEKLSKYDDIKSEFEMWIGTQEYPADGIEVEEYNAAKISELAPFMNSVGVYNFLVTLRDDPVLAKQTIADGFPRK